MRYWQVASGSLGRQYADAFLRYGMAFVGGTANVAKMSEVGVGDRIILKKGMSDILAVGDIVERNGKHRGVNDKEWLRDFDGWDLRAYCLVDWHIPEKPLKATGEGLTRSTIQGVNRKELKYLADKVVGEIPAQAHIQPEPADTATVEYDEIVDYLIRQGLRAGAAEELTATFIRIRRLARYYWNGVPWESVREHETRTFLVMPLLLALGWAEQQIKIELPVRNGGRADVACFSKPFRQGSQDCVLIVETKGFSQGLDYAGGQAERYAKQFPECRLIAVSNGYCYKTWVRQPDAPWERKPTAYLNLLRPKRNYPLDPDGVKGCLEVLSALLPNSGQ